MITIYLRHDQLISDIGRLQYQNQEVTIYGPEWVQSAVNTLSKHISPGTELCVIDRKQNTHHAQISQKLTLKDCVILSRNEARNVSGAIQFSYYSPAITDHGVIYSLKDLARQTVIVGRDRTVRYGGYCAAAHPQNVPVIVCDLIGLQFQLSYNSGRLVLIGPDVPTGLLDDMIYQQVVGEPRKALSQVASDNTGRYVKHRDVYFDTYAYRMFVANDFYLVCCAVNDILATGGNNCDNITGVNLKFLKYGTGFFAGSYRDILAAHIGAGVAEGLRKLRDSSVNTCIKCFEFPFYTPDETIANLCREMGCECVFSTDDALKQGLREGLMTATTNCADGHVVTGNEMGYSSVDAAIAENLLLKGMNFSPVINREMSVKFLGV